MPEAHRPSVVLIGPMAAGKSRIGRRVAKLLDEPFVDTDKVVVAQHGPIPGIFAERGEAAFRALERAAVADALRGPGVVSLGGGAVLDPSTQAELAALPVVLLMSSPETAEQRLQGGDDRPALGGRGIAGWIEVLEKRLPTYEALAQHTVDTSHRPATTLAEEIAKWVRETSGRIS